MVWHYSDFYLRFSSRPYSADDFVHACGCNPMRQGLQPHASRLQSHASRLQPHASSRLQPHASRLQSHAPRLQSYVIQAPGKEVDLAVHLTNQCIQKQCGEYGADRDIECNMWSSVQMEQHLQAAARLVGSSEW